MFAGEKLEFDGRLYGAAVEPLPAPNILSFSGGKTQQNTLQHLPFISHEVPTETSEIFISTNIVENLAILIHK